MARIRRHSHPIAAALLGLAALAFAPALAQDQGPKDGADLYDRPVLAIDPGMHTASIRTQAVDAAGRYAVTGGDDRTVRVWSAADGKLLRTIWIPLGLENVGRVYAVAISPDGSMIAVGGYTERITGGTVIYLVDRASGSFIKRINDDLPNLTLFLTFSPDGHYLAATLSSGHGLRVFDRDKDWGEAFRDDQYGDSSYGAAFARDGRLATAADDGLVRSYQYDPNSSSPNFRRAGQPVRGLSGNDPEALAFSPDGKRLAVGYYDVAAVDVLDGATFARVGGHKPTDAKPSPAGLEKVAWSRDGQSLYAAGGVNDSQDRRLLFAWDRGGLGNERRMTYCVPDTAADVDVLPGGLILVAGFTPCVGLMDPHGRPIWTVATPILDFRWQTDEMRVSADGKIVDFGYGDPGEAVLRFDLRSLILSSPPLNDGLTLAPNREGLTVDGWRNGTSPTLSGQALPFIKYERGRSLAIAPDAKSFFLGSSYALTAFDDTGAQKWRRRSRNEVWAVNATKDGRIIVTASYDGAIRWHRADDGRELLALQVLPNGNEPAKWDWVLWTPEGFYDATPGAENALKWVVNHGPDSAATVLPVSAIPRLHRPDALPLILQELETARAVGIAEVAASRLAVQKATGSAKAPGARLHVLAIGIDTFGDKAGGLHLDYAAEDARDTAETLLESQKIAPGKASLYAAIDREYLPNEQATHAAILDALDRLADKMRKSGSDQDVAVILISTHGEMFRDKFYLIPYDFDISSPTAAAISAVGANEIGDRVKDLAQHGKVLLLIDACRSGLVGPGGWATSPDSKALRDALTMENVAILTSSDKNGLSEELPDWRHGALTQAFLDALTAAADTQGVVRLSALTDAMNTELQSLTKGRQRLGMHVNFGGDLFMAGHY